MHPASGPELLLFGRVLVAFSPDQRAAAAAAILEEVEIAARHLRHHLCCHPRFGDGSLMARCLRLGPSAEPPAHDRDFLSAMIYACMALRDHQNF